jgi:hypothetical protein
MQQEISLRNAEFALKCPTKTNSKVSTSNQSQETKTWCQAYAPIFHKLHDRPLYGISGVCGCVLPDSDYEVNACIQSVLANSKNSFIDNPATTDLKILLEELRASDEPTWALRPKN